MNIRVLLFLIISVSLSFAKSPWRTNEMEIKVEFTNISQVEALKDFGFMGDIYEKSGYALLYVVPSELKMIQNSGLQTIIIEDNLDERSSTFWNKMDQRASHMTYEQIISLMNSLVSAYPDICMKKVYGESVDGRELSALKISDNVNENEPEPEILFDGGIHGDELGGPENVIRFAEYLCEEYGRNTEVSELIDSREIWLYCMVNPDGHVYLSRANSNNVDLNRNWGYMWNGECNTSKGFSQPETKAIRNCLLDNQFSIQVTNHSGIEAIFLPWCYTSTSAPEYDLQESLSNIYLASSGYGYFEICQSNHDYPTTGETVDYSYGVMGTAALTMELSTNKQPYDPVAIYNKNRDAMLEMVNASGNGIEGFVTDAVTGDPVAARLYFDNSYPSYSDSELGDYHKYLGSGNYSIVVEANGYKTKTVNTVSISHNIRSVINDIELEPDSSGSIYGYKIVYLKKCNGVSYKALGKNDGNGLALGSNGEVVIDMQYYLSDESGDDLKVYSLSGNYQCAVSDSIDGPWLNLGSGNGEQSFDFNGVVSDRVRYVKIAGSNVNLDAIESRYDKETSNYLSKNSFKTVPKILMMNNIVFISGINSQKSEINVFNSLGKKCNSYLKDIDGIVNLNLKNLSSGIYFINIQNRNSSFTHKVSISR